MSCVLNICGLGLNVSCEEACLQINPGDVPWYLISFHTKNHKLVWMKTAGLKRRDGLFCGLFPFLNVEFSRPGTDPHGRTDLTTCFMCAQTHTLSDTLFLFLLLTHFNCQHFLYICKFTRLGSSHLTWLRWNTLSSSFLSAFSLLIKGNLKSNQCYYPFIMAEQQFVCGINLIYHVGQKHLTWKNLSTMRKISADGQMLADVGVGPFRH